MDEPFDPYYTWLAISKADQPPNHYRLLAIDLFEPNPDVISNAADQRMAHLRTFQAGKHGPLSQKLLNEVAAARVTLLNPQKKAAYDDGLRQRLAVPDTGAREESSSNVRLQAELAEIAEASHHLPARQQPSGTSLWSWAAVALIMAPVACGILWFASRRPPEIAQREPEKRSNTAPVPESPESKPELPVARRAKLPARAAIRGEKAAQKPTVAMGPSTEIPAAAASNVPGPTAGRAAVSPPPATTVPSESPGGSPSTKPSTSPTTMPLPKQPEAASGPRQAPETSASRQKEDKPTSKPSGPLVAANRQPVPSEDVLAEAMKAAQEVYGAEYEKARTAVARQAVAKKVLAAGLATQGSLAQRFVLLRLARDVAVKGEDDKLAFAAIDGIRETFEIDLAAMKGEALAGLAKAVRSPTAHKAVAEKAAVLAEEALSADNLTIAEQMARLAMTESGKAKDKDLGVRARTLIKDVQEAAKGAIAVDAARTKLKESPDDAEANLVLGRYLCYSRGEWDRGLPHLSLVADKELRALAESELRAAKIALALENLEGVPRPDAGRMAITMFESARRLADGWWEQGQKLSGRQHDQAILHAGDWYGRAAIGDDLRVRSRIEQIDKIRFQTPPPPLAVAPFDQRQAQDHQRRWGKYLGVPVTITNSVGMSFVLIPPGEFTMGSPQEEHDWAEAQGKANNETDWYMYRLSGEIPQHRVRITKPFYLSVFEVTQSQYQQVVASDERDASTTKSRAIATSESGQHPMGVIWEEAQALCERLSSLPPERSAHRMYQLPTEAQWEFSCRAGTTTRWYSGDEEADAEAVAWVRGNSRGHSHPVGQKRPNAFGLYDMHGNVWEWCHDWEGRDYYQRSPLIDPPGPQKGSLRVLRGGHWGHPFYRSRAAFRGSDPPAARTTAYGIRLVCLTKLGAFTPRAETTGSAPR